MGKKKQLVKDNDVKARQKKLSNNKKNSRRNSEQYPGLKYNLFSKIKQEYHDYDYLDKLSPEEKEWLSQFTEEYLGANLKPNKKHYKRKKNIHPAKYNKEIFGANNSRNRDIHSISKVTGKLDFDIVETEDYEVTEDDMIDYIDAIKCLEDNPLVDLGDESGELVESEDTSSES